MTEEQRVRVSRLLLGLYALAISLGWEWDEERQEWRLPLEEGEDGTV